ncbi:MAG TPA: N-acyl-D-amino-acid deacylase, partial [Planctomycetaceae bacterium]|nr:N-acyl-D-amino-acid deacylase [Planctomycetaceae bacterium]
MDLIIRNGTVIDGTGQPRFQADVGVKNGMIIEVGVLMDVTASEEFDATGKIVCPGFIDVHNHSDGWLLRDGHQTCKTQQGFTTEIIMSDGISYAPVSSLNWRDWIYYLRGLNGLRMQDYTGWESLDDYLQILATTRVQNFAAQIPYANLRTLVHDF